MSLISSTSLIILDRDGVINQDSPNYIRKVEDFIPIPGSIDAIVRLQKAEKTVVIASNQSGLARGYFSQETLTAIHQKLASLLEAKGGVLPALFICPHGPAEGCACRKPLPGLFARIATHYGALQGVPAVGDSLRDLQAAQLSGATPILVKTGNGPKTMQELPDDIKPDIYENLEAFVNATLGAPL